MAKNLFNDLFSALSEATAGVVKKHETSNTVIFIKNNIKKIESIIKTLDKMLQARNINVKEIYEGGKATGKSYLKKGKSLLTAVKTKGFIETAKGAASDIRSKLDSVFKGGNEDSTPPPEEGNIKKPTKKPVGGFVKANSGWIAKAQEREDKGNKEIEEEKKATQERAKKPKGNGWLGKILTGIASVGSFLLTGITKAVGFLGGFVVKGIGKALFKMVPFLSKTIAKFTSGIVGTVLKAGGGIAWAGAKAVAGAALPGLGAAATMIGKGALMLATGPVGWVLAAGAAIGAGYLLYKYLTKNNVANDIYGKLTRLRLLMYGFNDAKKEYYSKIFDLEMLLKKYVKFNKNKVTLRKLDEEGINSILEIFNVTREEKDKNKLLNRWLNGRFLPAYTSYLQTLYSINPDIYFDGLDKLKDQSLFDFVTRLSVPSNLYNVEEAPTFEDPKIHVTKQEIDAELVNIVGMVKAKQKDKTDPAKKTEEENKKMKAAVEAKLAKNASPQAPTVPKPKLLSPTDVASDLEGEKKPSDKQDTKTLESKVNSKLNKASGEMTPGSLSMEGIQTKLPIEKIHNLDPNVRELFTGMAKEYNTLTNKSIPVNEAARSYEDQAALYKSKPGLAAKPGNSVHEFGLGIDIDSAVADELDKLGLMRKYGFTRPIGQEKWHIEPIGVALNPNMAKQDMRFRHNAITVSPGKGGEGYGTLASSVKLKRNMEYQLAIYNKDGENTIDPAKALSKQPGNSVATLGPIKEPSRKEPNTETSSVAQPLVAQTPGKETSKTSEPVATRMAPKPLEGLNLGKTNHATSSPDLEGEKKPSIKQDKSILDNTKPTVPANTNVDIGKYASLAPVPAIKQASKMTGMDESTMMAYAKMESSLQGGSIKNKNSSATGLFQIVDGTWNELVSKHGNKYGLPPDAKPDNNYYNALMASEYAKYNLASLPSSKETGISDPTGIYLAHHYGTSGGKNIIKTVQQNPNTPMKDTVSQKAFNSNKAAIGNHTVGSYIQTISNKISDATNTEYKATDTAKTPAVDVAKAPATNIAKIPATDVVKTPPSNKINAALTPEPSSPAPSQPSAFSSPTTQPKQSAFKTADHKPLDPVSNQQKQPIVDTSEMEILLSDQLTTLTQIATILTSINGKIDFDKLKELGSSNNKTPATPSIDKSIPKGSVNLSKKSVLM